MFDEYKFFTVPMAKEELERDFEGQIMVESVLVIIEYRTIGIHGLPITFAVRTYLTARPLFCLCTICEFMSSRSTRGCFVDQMMSEHSGNLQSESRSNTDVETDLEKSRLVCSYRHTFTLASLSNARLCPDRQQSTSHAMDQGKGV